MLFGAVDVASIHPAWMSYFCGAGGGKDHYSGSHAFTGYHIAFHKNSMSHFIGTTVMDRQIR